MPIRTVQIGDDHRHDRPRTKNSDNRSPSARSAERQAPASPGGRDRWDTPLRRVIFGCSTTNVSTRPGLIDDAFGAEGQHQRGATRNCCTCVHQNTPRALVCTPVLMHRPCFHHVAPPLVVVVGPAR